MLVIRQEPGESDKSSFCGFTFSQKLCSQMWHVDKRRGEKWKNEPRSDEDL